MGLDCLVVTIKIYGINMSPLQRWFLVLGRLLGILIMLYSLYSEEWAKAAAWGIFVMVLAIELILIDCAKDDE